MPADHRYSQFPDDHSTRGQARSVPSMSRQEKVLIAVILVGYGILHVVGGTLLSLSPAADSATIEQAAPAHLGD